MKEDVILHILAQKENLYRKENIEKYIEIVENRIFIKDGFDRAIAAVFELVIEKQINPWEIDLAAFSSLYLKKVKDEGINLIVAGKILFLAWKILRLQSEEMIRDMERREEEIYFDDIPDWYGDDEIFIQTQRIMKNEVVLKPKIRRKAQRKVTLVELINAFEEAKEELVKKSRRQKKIINPAKMEDSTHKEDIENDIKNVMEKLSKLNGEAVPLRELFDGKDIVAVLLPLLFLAKDGLIEVWQENFPYGEIYIKLKHES